MVQPIGNLGEGALGSSVEEIRACRETCPQAGPASGAGAPASDGGGPWGSYDSIDAGERFLVKRIVVNPQASLSRQLHHHRAEHWIVVRGTARVTRSEESFLLSENETVYIPLGTRHRLENLGKVPLEMIEVQSGAYLGEDDIVRFEDSYGRG